MFDKKTMVGRSPQQKWLDRWSYFLPILDWGLHYQRAHLPGDLTAGIIVVERFAKW